MVKVLASDNLVWKNDTSITWIARVIKFHFLLFFFRPSSDGTFYGMAMFVRVSVNPSVSDSFPHYSPTCFDFLSWNCVCHFFLMNIRSSSSTVNLRKFLLELYTVFCTFLLHALTYWAEILHMTLFYCSTDQVWVSSIFVGVMPLLDLRILKIHNFRTFLLHALTYWAEILHMALFYSSTDQFECRQFL